jgi:hypothetical protein
MNLPKCIDQNHRKSHMWLNYPQGVVSWLPCLLDNYWFNMDQQYDIHKSMFTMDWTSFVPFSFFRVNLTVLSALLRFTNFEYAFGIFKLILFKLLSLLDKNYIHTLPLNLKAMKPVDFLFIRLYNLFSKLEPVLLAEI